jgi:hypothetical protein
MLGTVTGHHLSVPTPSALLGETLISRRIVDAEHVAVVVPAHAGVHRTRRRGGLLTEVVFETAAWYAPIVVLLCLGVQDGGGLAAGDAARARDA